MWGPACNPPTPSPQLSLSPSPAVTRPPGRGLCWGWVTGRYWNGGQGRGLGCLLPQEQEGQQQPWGPCAVLAFPLCGFFIKASHPLLG